MVLTGILMQSNRLASTDTNRLHVADLASELADWKDVIVPGAAMAMLAKVLNAKPDTAIEIAVTVTDIDPCYIHFRVGDSILSGRIIEGQFPEYERVIPGVFDRTIEVNPATLIDATSSLASIAVENCNRIVIRVNGEEMQLSATSNISGSASVPVPVQMECDSAHAFAINCKFLIDCLSPFTKCKTVNIGCGHELSPIVVTSPDHPRVKAVLMPMQLED